MMRKFLLATLICSFLFLSACDNNLSNIDVKKLNEKASEYMQAGDYEKAVSRLESSLDLNPEPFETYYNLGVAYYQLNDYEKALKSLDEAIKKNEKLADAYFSRAIVYEDWAYSILEGEGEQANLKEPSSETKELSMKYLQNAKVDFEKYLELKKNAKDKDDVHEKIIQIENELNISSDEKIGD